MGRQDGAHIEGLVAERYGGLTEDSKSDRRDATPTPAKPPDESNPTPLQVNAPEPLDGRDPNPRAGHDRGTGHSDDPSDDVAIGGSTAGSKGVSIGKRARRERLGRAAASSQT